MCAYRLFAIDLDDTLLNSSHAVSERNVKALNAVRNQGGIVILASGRMAATMKPTADLLEITTPLICYNGAIVRDRISGKDIMKQTVPIELSNEVMQFASDNNLQLNFYEGDSVYSEKETEWMQLYAKRTGAKFIIIPDFMQQLKGLSPIKLIIVDSPQNIERLLPEMQERYSGRLNVMRSNSEYLEFLPLLANKGSALEFVANMFNVDIRDTVAIGDSWNDIPMLQRAGLGVAVGNAKPEVQASAGMVVSTSDDDGVAEALEKLFHFEWR